MTLCVLIHDDRLNSRSKVVTLIRCGGLLVLHYLSGVHAIRYVKLRVHDTIDCIMGYVSKRVFTL